LTEGEQRAFSVGKLVVRDEEGSGLNLCSAFHPESYVREQLASGFTVADFLPAETPRNPLHQDLYLHRKDGH